ncbi:hypothetical protein ACFLRF_06540 [Candidatus Altiarchaeota archaeon]
MAPMKEKHAPGEKVVLAGHVLEREHPGNSDTRLLDLDKPVEGTEIKKLLRKQMLMSARKPKLN